MMMIMVVKMIVKLCSSGNLIVMMMLLVRWRRRRITMTSPSLAALSRSSISPSLEKKVVIIAITIFLTFTIMIVGHLKGGLQTNPAAWRQHLFQ